MTSSSESAGAVLALFLLLQLVGFLALLIGGIYLLACLQRAANGLDRMASVAEEWLHRQNMAPPAVPAPPVAPVPPTGHTYPHAAPYLPGNATPDHSVPPIAPANPSSTPGSAL